MNSYYKWNNKYKQLELYFDYNYFKALDDEQKKELKSKFRWDNGFKCWYREYSKGDFDNCLEFVNSLKLENGGWDRGTDDELNEGDTIEVRREAKSKDKEVMTVVECSGYVITLRDANGTLYQKKFWSTDRLWTQRHSIENFEKIENFKKTETEEQQTLYDFVVNNIDNGKGLTACKDEEEFNTIIEIYKKWDAGREKNSVCSIGYQLRNRNKIAGIECFNNIDFYNKLAKKAVWDK